MALTKPVTEVVTNQTVAASSEMNKTNCLTTDTTTTISLAVEVKCTFNASATAGATVYVYSSGDNVNWSTVVIDSFDIPLTAGSTVRMSKTISPAEKYLKVTFKNNDASYSVTACYAYMHAQKVS